jgi:AbrB family looped-hinge helix DNA binding protein
MYFAIVMDMKNTVTVTSKGQTTIPAPIRRKLGLDRTGGVLEMNFNENKNELVISKAISVDELSKKLSGYIKPGVKPLMDADAFYQANRTK